ncbi:MAG: Gfo/Idh/MocA family oxidoreductase [Proteobacteria bacterium]|nr:Gfo/Idh/MocA family oxidoreductase [Pseudomonadota bacterium]MBU1686532.1 Gfo/Idh/MocA family oxidoreductase [Pseudomonadota bacterium]
MQQVRVGVIGVGYLGKFHAQKYAAMPGVDFIGVTDANPDTARKVAAEHGVMAFPDYHQLLRETDAVSVVVPTSLHFDVARDCLNSGTHVMLEKPMTTTVEEADELIRLADQNGSILQVGHLERFNPAVMALDQFITTPLFIESHRIHVFKNRALDVDVVLDLMIHDIDLILNIVKSPIQTIHTVGLPVVTHTTDIANARLIFENGCTANITVSRISQENIRRLRIFQPNSFISVDYGKKELTVIRLLGEMDENNMPRQEVISSCFMEKDALQLELEDFVNNVRNGLTPIVSGREGRRALQVASEIIQQIRDHARQHSQQLGLGPEVNHP